MHISKGDRITIKGFRMEYRTFAREDVSIVVGDTIYLYDTIHRIGTIYKSDEEYIMTVNSLYCTLGMDSAKYGVYKY